MTLTTKKPQRHFALASSHHHSFGNAFFSGQTWSSVSPSNSSPFFMTKRTELVL